MYSLSFIWCCVGSVEKKIRLMGYHLPLKKVFAQISDTGDRAKCRVDYGG